MTPDQKKILDIKTLQIDRRRNSAGYPFKTFEEMACDTPAKNWLIKGVLARGETSAWIAPPGDMKSALLAQAAVCVAAGLDWQGNRNKGAAGVVYFALERADLVEKRIRAHCLRLGLKSVPIAVVPVTFDLIKPDLVKRCYHDHQGGRDGFRHVGRPLHLRHLCQTDCCRWGRREPGERPGRRLCQPSARQELDQHTHIHHRAHR